LAVEVGDEGEVDDWAAGGWAVDDEPASES
jgi:hypothetical protein